MPDLTLNIPLIIMNNSLFSLRGTCILHEILYTLVKKERKEKKKLEKGGRVRLTLLLGNRISEDSS